MTRAETVEQLIVTPDDKEFTDLVLTSTDGKAGGLTTTWHHPFWDATTKRWTNASELKPGGKLRTPDGTLITVSGVRNYHQAVVTYDLTVERLHTYYVLAGTAPVLVHNCGDDEASDELLDLADANIGNSQVAAEIETSGGDIARDISQPRAGGSLHPIVQSAVDATGHHGGCAEVGCVNQLVDRIVQRGGNVDELIGSRVTPIKIGGRDFPMEEHTEAIPPCQSCVAFLKQFGIG